MAQAYPPNQQLNFGGVITSGNALRRPPDTSIRCMNLRPMPGGALRLRSGKTIRLFPTAAVTYVQWHEFRKGSLSAGLYHLVQQSSVTIGDRWIQVTLPDYIFAPLLTVNGATTGLPLAVTSVRDKVWLANGWGQRDGTRSKPPFTSWDGSRLRYVGLDAYCVGGNPTASFAVGAGNNRVINSIKIYVGLHNTATGHFGNGVLAGTIGTTASNGTITVNNLTRLTTAFHDTQEQNELRYVFYSSLDGGVVPYLILNAAGTDIHSVAVTATSTSLSLTANGTNGFLLDLASEMPTENWPPRPMEQIAYSNGRVYGILKAGGTGAADTYGGFTYIVPEKDAAAIAYSASADMYADRDFVGVPEESWPLTNKKFIPNGERPLKVSEGPNRGQAIAITATGSFYLEEAADGLIIPEKISETRGIGDTRSFARTPFGPIWVTRDREIVLLEPGSMRLIVLSSEYSELLSTIYAPTIGVAADYLLDPNGQIDRYQVWGSNGYSVIHDFELERDQRKREVSIAQAYSSTGPVLSSAATLRDSTGARHHLIAHEAVWTHEGTNGVTPTRDQNTDGSYSEPSGDWVGQWSAYGDITVRKEYNRVHIIGDAEPSRQLLGLSPIRYSWYGDLVGGDEFPVELLFASQEDDQSLLFSGTPKNAKKRWYKHRIQIFGHSGDSIFLQYPTLQSFFSEVAFNVYGSIFRLDPTIVSEAGNRP